MEGANSTTCAQPGYDQGFKLVVHKCNRINSQNGGGSGGGDFGSGIFNFAEGRPAWRNEHGSAWERQETEQFDNAGGNAARRMMQSHDGTRQRLNASHHRH